jgi:excisionase family DNA binding protein
MLPLPDAAEALGISLNTLRAWIYRRRIGYVKIGRSVRISRETIDKIITRGTIPPLEAM